jgi:hypothetical protein
MTARLYRQYSYLTVSESLSVKLCVDSEAPDADCVFVDRNDMIVLSSGVFALVFLSPEDLHTVRCGGDGLAAALV